MKYEKWHHMCLERLSGSAGRLEDVNTVFSFVFFSCCICKVNKHAHTAVERSPFGPVSRWLCDAEGYEVCTLALISRACVAGGGEMRICVFEGTERLRAGGELVWVCFWHGTVGGALALYALDVKFDFEAFGNWVIMMDTKRKAQPRES